MVVLFQSARSSVFEATYFGISFMRRVNAASPPSRVGQKAAQIWYVVRPMSRASAPKRSSMLYRSSSSSWTRRAQALRPSRCSSKPGASMTPSTVTKDVAISRIRAA